MTLNSSSPVLSPWMLRRDRAVQLLDKTSHSEEVLAFYVDLVGLQERVADSVPLDNWAPLVQAENDSAVLLAVDRLPVNELVHRFDDFELIVPEMAGVEPIVLPYDPAQPYKLVEIGEGAWDTVESRRKTDRA